MNVSAKNFDETREDQTIDISTRLLPPWSTPVMQTRLPERILQMMDALTDATLESDTAQPYGHGLATGIKNSPLLASKEELLQSSTPRDLA